ncbi:MAG: peptidylprolyl isomerase [Hyphomicrobium sp.]
MQSQRHLPGGRTEVEAMRRIVALMLMTVALGVAGCGDDTPVQPPKRPVSSGAVEPGNDTQLAGKVEFGTTGATTPEAEGDTKTAAVENKPAGSKADSNRLVMELKSGKVEIDLLPDLAPEHVARVKKLTREGFYNGLKFHRVIDGFMAQTGDPTGTGMGGSDYPNVPAEFTSTPYERGTIGAARTPDPNSANSQFFICFNDTGCKKLTGAYTVWGRVASGMEFVDEIKKGDRDAGGSVTDPDVIVKMYLQ